MTEASRVSVAVEVTGLDKARGEFSQFENTAKRTADAAEAAMARLEKSLASAAGSFASKLNLTPSAQTLEKFEASSTAAALAARNLEAAIEGVFLAQGKLNAQRSGLSPLRGTYKDAQRAADEASQSILRMIGATDGVSKSAKDSARAFEDAFAKARRWGDQVGKSFRFDEVGRSAEEASRSFETLFKNQDRVSQGFADIVNQRANVFDGVTRSAEAASQSFVKLLENQQKVIRQTQDGIDSRLGINSTARSARDAASSFAGVPTVEETRAKYNPLFEIGLRYREQVEGIKLANAEGSLSFAEMTMAIERAGQVATMSQNAYINTSKTLEIAGGAAKLTTYQMTNLGYQINDIGTMLAMGASPFQIISSQAGQVVQALGDNPGGVSNSLKAIGAGIASAASAIGPFGFAMAGVVAGAAALAFTMKTDVAPVEEMIDRQAAAVKNLKNSYNLAADAVEDYGRRARPALQFQAGEDYTKDLKQMQDRVLSIGNSIFGGKDNARRQTLPEFDALRAAYNELFASAKEGTPDFIAFQNTLARIADSNPEGSWWSDTLGDAAREALEMSKGLGEVQLALEGTNEKIDAGAQAARRMTATFRDAMATLRDLGPASTTAGEAIEIAFLDASHAAQSMGDAMAALNAKNAALAELARPAEEAMREAQNRLNNFDLSPVAKAVAETTQEYERRMDELLRTQNDAASISALIQEREAALLLITKEATRAEETRRAGYQLDLASVNDRTAAQKANTEAERARIEALGRGETAAEAAGKAEEARTLALAKARAELTLAYEQMSRANANSLQQASFEFSLIGKTAGETARLRTEYELLARAKEIAYSAGMNEDEVQLTDAMKSQALVIGELTEATLRLGLAREQADAIKLAQAEATYAFASEKTRSSILAGLQAEIDLRRQGIDVNTEWAQTYIANERNLEAFRVELGDQIDMFTELKDAIKATFLEFDTGKSILDNVTSAFAKLGGSLASKGFDSLFGNVGSLLGIGGGGQGSSPAAASGGIGNIVSSLGSVASSLGQATRSTGNIRNFTPVAANSYSVPTPSSRPMLAQSEVATANSSMLTYASRFNSNIDQRLVKILETAATRFPYKVEAISGLRPGDPRFHGKGLAADVQIYGANGKPFNNYQHAGDFRVYEQFAQQARVAQQQLFPELDKLFRFGGYFSGGKGKYGALDSMHFDLGGAGMGGGSWENGLTPAMRKLWAGVTSVGMGRGTAASPMVPTPTASPAAEQRLISRGVSDGMQDYTRRAQTGGGGAALPAGFHYQNEQGQSVNHLGVTRGQQVMGGIGAGVGIFSQGYQSGSPLSGGVSGALGGFQAAQALGVAGPVGAIAGAAIGILGGILGGRKQREQEHRDKAAEWEKMRPQYEAFDRSLSDKGTGQLREWITTQAGQLNTFMQTAGEAWKYGKGGTSADFQATGTKMFDRFGEMMQEFRDQFRPTLDDLNRGDGLNGAFSQARAAVKALEDQIDAFLDDTAIAFGSEDLGIATSEEFRAAAAASKAFREEQIELAKQASGQYALSLLYTADATSDVQKTLDGFAGTAKGLTKILIDLGWEADKAASDIDEKLNLALADIRSTFVEGFEAQIREFENRGYENDVMALLKDRDTAVSDAKLLGVDPEIVTRWFTLAAQSVVDGAELSGDAFAALVKQFPELAGVVKEFTEVAASATEAQEKAAAGYERALSYELDMKNQLRSAYQKEAGELETLIDRHKRFQESVRDFLKGMRLGDDSPLGGKDKFLEAQEAFRKDQAAALAGDEGAQDRLLESSQAYLEAARNYYKSSEDYYTAFYEVESVLKAADAKATQQISVSEQQLTSLRTQVERLISIDEGVKSVAEAIAALAVAQAAVGSALTGLNGVRDWGANPERNKALVAELAKQGLNYTGNFGSGGHAEWVASLNPAQQALANQIANSLNHMLRPVPGFSKGGFTGYGNPMDVAGYAHKGEVVFSQSDVAWHGGPATVDAMRRSRTYAPVPANDMAGRVADMSGLSSMETLSELRGLRNDNQKLLSILITTTGGRLTDTIDAIERGNEAAELAALAATRNANKGSKVA